MTIIQKIIGWNVLYILKIRQFDNFKINNVESVKGENQTDRKVTVKINDGFIKRRKYFIDSNGIIEMMIPLHCDLIQCDRLLKDFRNAKLKFTRNKDKFLLKGSDASKFKLIVSHMELFVTKCLMNNVVKTALLKTLQNNTMKDPKKYCSN